MQRYPTPDTDELAGVLDRRAEAFIIDGLLVALVLGLVGYVAGTVLAGGPLGGAGGTIVALQFAAPIVFPIYQGIFEGYYGQTIGKAARGLVVVKEDGSRCTWGAAVLRNILRLIDMLPVFYLVGIVTAYVASNYKRVGDIAANTIVVHTAE